MNKNGFAFSGMIYSILIIFMLLIFSILSLLQGRKLLLDKLKYKVINNINNNSLQYNDKSGANQPNLLDNMIPIKYNGQNWIYASKYEPWYNYNEKEWANAVVLNSNIKNKNVGDVINESEIKLWFVWIPRYKYQLFNVEGSTESNPIEINILFEKDNKTSGDIICNDIYGTGDLNAPTENCINIKNNQLKAKNGDWYTHPAFTFGLEEIPGFWISKFELSGTLDNINIKPNTSQYKTNSLVNYNIYDFSTNILNISKQNNINGDSHMIKNMEWGAVAYLSQSKYGKGLIDIETNLDGLLPGGNNYKNNSKQSTTLNIYGVYDLAGGAWEYVMSSIAEKNGNFWSGLSGVNEKPEDKYIDFYRHSHSSSKLGDATKETFGWYNDSAEFPPGLFGSPWFTRGGFSKNDQGIGIFRFKNYNGAPFSKATTRAVLI